MRVPGRVLERAVSQDGLAAAEPPGEEYSAGLPGLRFISTALRRGIRVWAATAVLGAVTGLCLSVLLPPAAEVSTTIQLTHNPDDQPGSAILTDVALAQSRTVAERAMHELGLRQSVSSFLDAYTATVMTDRIMLITIGAQSDSAAEARARAVASVFLAYRAEQLRAQQRLVLQAIDQRLGPAQRQAAVLAKQLRTVQAEHPSPLRRARLKRVEAQSRPAGRVLEGLQLAAIDSQLAALTEVSGSGVLDGPAPVAHTHRFLTPARQAALLYASIGLVAGLVVGLALVIIRALVSDRLRQRDDVAHALDVPVRLSVGPVRVRRGLAAAQRPEVQRIAAHLRDALPRRGSAPAGLAVVAVDDPAVPALSLVSLAAACAREGQQVVLADLCPRAPAAGLLGVREPGISTGRADGAELTVVVPRDSVAPAGPLHPAASSAARRDPELTRACQGADILLSLVQLDPALGGEHLATWASGAVVMVTAGAASWAKIHAVGEMIRLAGTRLVSAVLIGADKTDESLGAAYPHPPAQDTPHPTPALTGEA